MQLHLDNTWKQVTIQNGNMPGEMYGHQFLTHLDNLFSFGGRINWKVTDKCFVINIKSSEVDPIMNLEKPTYGHTLYHIAEMVKAYICGGRTTDYDNLKEIIEFDILN